MAKRTRTSLAMHYVFLAVGCGILGIVITFLVIMVCQRFSIDIAENLWVLAIPVFLSVSLNVLFIELYRKFKKE